MNLVLWYPVRQNVNKLSYNSRADKGRLMAEQYDTKSNVNLGKFPSQLEVSYVSSHTEELWYSETVCL